MAFPPSCLPPCCRALPAERTKASTIGLHVLSILSWSSLSMKGNLCSSRSLLKADEGPSASPIHHLHWEGALQPWTQEVGMASKEAALCKTNGFLWPKWGQGTHCSRYLLVVKTLMWDLKVQVEILSQSELETIRLSSRTGRTGLLGKEDFCTAFTLL